ncbi:MAG: holo-ACP synthase [Wigglesworthia glossinidia]|nr:holo-ACP synthase [Wigglesworthia glossinidia]
MTIIGIGVDIVSIKRINKVILYYGKKFIKKILSKNEEIQYNQLLHTHIRKSTYFLAKRLAAKEAASKALGMGMRRGLSFVHFEVIHDHLGKPYLKLNSIAKSFLKDLNITDIHLSLTDERKYACAMVIFESNNLNY